MFLGILIFVPSLSLASEEEKTIIKLADDTILVNNEQISYEEGNGIYLTSEMNNGGTSEEAKVSNIKIDNIININKPGIYEFIGSLSNGQISVDANRINGDVEILLNNVQITCENAPAILIYSKNVENKNCNVKITLVDGSTNLITGSKIKTSVEGWNDQEDIQYYIEKGYDDDKQYYERYKYDGVISSDISLIFDGEGKLEIESTAKEGIESKMNLIFENGTYIINSLDDGINACSDGKSVITINGGIIVVNVSDEAEEGDGIDSNGSIHVNDGTVYSFACPGSDNGLDADDGIYINGGKVFSTGSMYEEAKTENNTKIVQMQFSSEVNSGDSIVVVDEDEKSIFAYKTDRKVSNIIYTSGELSDKEYSVYTGKDIVGKIGEYNIYSYVEYTDLENMKKQENTGGIGKDGKNISVEINKTSNKNNKGLIVIGCVLTGVFICILVMAFKGATNKK